MIQLEIAEALPTACLPPLEIGRSEPPTAATLPGDDAALPRPATVAPADLVPYVSPPPMSWPRIFPGL